MILMNVSLKVARSLQDRRSVVLTFNCQQKQGTEPLLCLAYRREELRQVQAAFKQTCAMRRRYELLLLSG